MQVRMPVVAGFVPAVVVPHQEDDIGAVGCVADGAGEQQSREYEQEEDERANGHEGLAWCSHRESQSS